MNKTVAELKDNISGILQGLNLNNVKNTNFAIERTARQMCSKLSISQAMGRENITLYSGVTDYLAPTSIYGSYLIDMQPQGNVRTPMDYVYKDYISDFDRTKAYQFNGASLSFESKKGVDIIRISSTKPLPKIELDPMTDTTGWVTSGSASGLTKDENIYYRASSSLRMLLTGASTGILTKTIPRVDITSYVGVGVVFLAIMTPADGLSSLSIKIGTDASNYYTVSNTTGMLGSWVVGEWTIVALDLSLATTVGTPTPTNIVYSQISMVHANTLTNFRIGDFWIALPSPQTLLFETSAIFQASGSNPSSTITTADDSILLNEPAYVIFEQECAITIANQQGATLADRVVSGIEEYLYGNRAKGINGLYDLYRTKNPSQVINTIGNWYDN
uniref:Uncharacterized protein n=1 Tax=uncultured marine virus TaxID=186617 RepID=A0A0F7L789_9VIRU|nr:hypothetical protein [uncultured marine virus]